MISNTKNGRQHLEQADEVETSGFRNQVPGDAVDSLDDIIGRGSADWGILRYIEGLDTISNINASIYRISNDSQHQYIEK